jgi:hypothetical protein
VKEKEREKKKKKKKNDKRKSKHEIKKMQFSLCILASVKREREDDPIVSSHRIVSRAI